MNQVDKGQEERTWVAPLEVSPDGFPYLRKYAHIRMALGWAGHGGRQGTGREGEKDIRALYYMVKMFFPK